MQFHERIESVVFRGDEVSPDVRSGRFSGPMSAEDDPSGEASAGFAAIDALVALTILAATLSLSLSAAMTARRAAGRAAEIQSADTLLRSLLDRGVTGGEAGRTTLFAWNVGFAPAGDGQGSAHIQLCRCAADARSLHSGRHYKMATLVACPARSKA